MFLWLIISVISSIKMKTSVIFCFILVGISTMQANPRRPSAGEISIKAGGASGPLGSSVGGVSIKAGGIRGRREAEPFLRRPAAGGVSIKAGGARGPLGGSFGGVSIKAGGIRGRREAEPFRMLLSFLL